MEGIIALERQIDTLCMAFMHLSRRGWVEENILRDGSITSQESVLTWWRAVEYYRQMAWIAHAELITTAASVYGLDEDGDHRATFEW